MPQMYMQKSENAQKGLLLFCWLFLASTILARTPPQPPSSTVTRKKFSLKPPLVVPVLVVRKEMVLMARW